MPHPIACKPQILRLAIQRSIQCTVATAITVYAGSALAQSTATTTRADAPELQEILVIERSIETTLPLELARYGADLEIITSAQVKDHGFVDVSQALELLVPGVHLTTQAGAFSYINLAMQGSRNSDVLWTVDGVRINNRLYNSTSPADTLPSSMIERTEVLKGGHGLMYGTQAIAGVVNVVTRSFSDTPGGEVSIGSGSHGLQRLNAYGRGALGEHRFIAWVSRDASDGYEIYDNYQPTAVYRKRGYDVESVGLKYGYDFTQDLSLTLMGIHTEATLDYPNVSNVSINDRTEDILSARLDYTPSDSVQYFLKAYHHTWDTDYYTPPNPSAYWGYEDFGVSAATVLTPHRNFEYHLGYDFQTYTGKDDVLLIDGEREDVHAIYAQIRSTDDLAENVRFALGVRHNETGGNKSTVWNTSGIYEFSDSLYVQGIIGSSFMLPSAENLYRIHCPSGLNCTHGNPNLAPEESISLNMSIGGRWDVGQQPLSWQLSAWDRHIDNLITTAPIDATAPSPYPPEFTRTFINISDEVKATGAELLLRGPITQALSFNVSYTYSKEIARGTRDQLPDRPRNNYKASFSFAPAERAYGVNLALKYIGDKTANVTGFGNQDYGDNIVLDMGAHLYLDANTRQHRLTVRLENLLDEEYATSVSSAVLTGSNPQERFMWSRLAPPRTLHVNYSYSF